MKAPLWSEDKAELIAEYIHRFLFVTKHGVYIDLFAGPQREDNPDTWSVKRVLERRTHDPAMNRYIVCDKERRQVQQLKDLAALHSDVQFCIHQGDANKKVQLMLNDGDIRPSTACFCLIDQRTLECHWSTVEAIAKHKAAGYKIELFYFLAERWLNRAWVSVKRPRKLHAWWGRSDHGQFFSLPSFNRAKALCQRFQSDLGYEFANPYSIHEKGPGSATMYYMIHATDHPRAPRLMSEAYRHIAAKRTTGGQQLELIG